MTSLRRWLVTALILVITVVGAATAWFSYHEGLTEADELFDAKLAHSARVLAGLVEPALLDATDASMVPLEIDVWNSEATGSGDDLVSENGHAYETKLAFQVWTPEGRLLLRSRSGPSSPLVRFKRGFGDGEIDGEHWRTFALWTPGGHWYLTGERYDIRNEIAEEIGIGTMLPLLVSLPVSALLVWWIIGLGLRPLQRVATQVERIGPDRLEPVPAQRVPSEVRPLLDAINRLIQRLTDALARERRFTADAAHELRTPLGALKVHATNLSDANDTAQRDISLLRVRDSILRMERLVGQLLLLSRSEPGAMVPSLAQFDLVACVRRELAELGPLAVQRNIDVTLVTPDTPVLVHGNEVAIGVLARNLLENAMRYTPPEGRVQVSIEPDVPIVLRIADSGPGIDESALPHVFERFYRALPTIGDGSGLGLSIVRNIAQMHGAQIILARAAELGGLEVQVRFASRTSVASTVV